MDETLRRMGLDKTRARKGAVRPKITGEDVRRMLADVATSGGVPFIDAASQAAQGNYGQAAISGLLDAPPVKMAGMALAPLAGMVKNVFHGTPYVGLLGLDPRKAMEVRGTTWFTDNPSVADQYRYPREYGEILYDEKPGDLFTANLLFKNPMTVDMKGDVGEAIRLGKLVEEAKQKGFDALVLKNVDDTIDSSRELGTSYAVWSPEMIELIKRNEKKIKKQSGAK